MMRRGAAGPVLVAIVAVAAIVGTNVAAHAAGEAGVVKVDADLVRFLAGNGVANHVVITARAGTPTSQ